jgi:hypothetical protein
MVEHNLPPLSGFSPSRHIARLLKICSFLAFLFAIDIAFVNLQGSKFCLLCRGSKLAPAHHWAG